MKKVFFSTIVIALASLFFAFFSLPKTYAQTQCQAEGGACTSPGLCAANCGSCTNTDSYNYSPLCTSGVCCDGSGIPPLCNTAPNCVPNGNVGPQVCFGCTVSCYYTEWNYDPSIYCVDYGGGVGPGTGWYCANTCNANQYCSGTTCVYYNCTYGAVCGACTGGNQPTNTCGTTTGSQTCTNEQPQPCTYNNYNRSCTHSYNNCSANYTCVNGNTCETTINAHAYIDYNHDGKQDNGEPNLAGVQLNDNGYIAYTDNNGNATDKNSALRSGVTAYVQMSVANPFNGIYYTNPTQVQNITLNNNNGGSWLYYNFIPEFTISGNVFIDYNHDGKQDNGEPAYTASTIQVTDGTHTVNTDANGNYSFPNEEIDGTYTISIVPASIPAQYQAVGPQNVTVTTNNVTNVGLGIALLYSISGEIYHDTDENGYLDNGEGGIQSGTLTINGANVPINADGTYSLGNLLSGNYTVAYTPAPGWQTIYPATSFNVTVGTPGQNPACNPGGYRGDGCDPWGNIVTLNIGINQLHTISGRIYDDVNKDDFYTIGVDSGLGKGTLTLTGPTNEKATINAGGTYTAANLLSGTYTVTYAPPDISWQGIYPPNLTTIVTVGNKGVACNPGNNHDSDNANGGGQTYTVCTATYDITGLNFGVTNEFAWMQGICTDMRTDTGFSDPVPTTANCGGTSAPYADYCPGGTVGIIYTGNADANFSLGGSSNTNWVVGGNPTTSYPETFTPVNKTVVRSSYAYVTATLQQAGITPTDLSTVCSLSNCSLPVALPSGVYLANGDLYIATQSAYGNSNLAYQAQPNTNVTILVNGTAYIDGKITIPQGNASAFTLISSGNITVDASVGEANVTSLASDLDGFYSTDQSFILNSAGSCNPDGTPQDKKFNAAGAIIVNAGEQGGSFQNTRDLCVSDTSCPVVTLSQRVDLLLNASSVTKHVNNFFQEVAP